MGHFAPFLVAFEIVLLIAPLHCHHFNCRAVLASPNEIEIIPKLHKKSIFDNFTTDISKFNSFTCFDMLSTKKINPNFHFQKSFLPKKFNLPDLTLPDQREQASHLFLTKSGQNTTEILSESPDTTISTPNFSRSNSVISDFYDDNSNSNASFMSAENGEQHSNSTIQKLELEDSACPLVEEESQSALSKYLVGDFKTENSIYPLFDNIIYFNCNTVLPMKTNTFQNKIDSEDEPGENLNPNLSKLHQSTSKDSEWQVTYSQFLIHDFDDISKSEKNLMNYWNYFVMSGGLKDDSKMVSVKNLHFFLEKFVLENLVKKILKNDAEKVAEMRPEIINFLCSFVSFGHMSAKQLENLLGKF